MYQKFLPQKWLMLLLTHLFASKSLISLNHLSNELAYYQPVLGQLKIHTYLQYH